jgi:hypothetical protein
MNKDLKSLSDEPTASAPCPCEQAPCRAARAHLA